MYFRSDANPMTRRSFATSDQDLSNDYANAAFVLRHWDEIACRLGVVSEIGSGLEQ